MMIRQTVLFMRCLPNHLAFLTFYWFYRVIIGHILFTLIIVKLIIYCILLTFSCENVMRKSKCSRYSTYPYHYTLYSHILIFSYTYTYIIPCVCISLCKGFYFPFHFVLSICVRERGSKWEWWESENVRRCVVDIWIILVILSFSCFLMVRM